MHRHHLKAKMTIPGLCAIQCGTAGYLTGDRRLLGKGLHVQTQHSSIDDLTHGLTDILFLFHYTSVSSVIHAETGPQPISIQRPVTHPKSTNLSRRGAASTSLHISTVWVGGWGEDKNSSTAQKVRHSPFLSGRFSVPFMRFNPHLCLLHLSALFPPVRERERMRGVSEWGREGERERVSERQRESAFKKIHLLIPFAGHTQGEITFASACYMFEIPP